MRLSLGLSQPIPVRTAVSMGCHIKGAGRRTQLRRERLPFSKEGGITTFDQLAALRVGLDDQTQRLSIL